MTSQVKVVLLLVVFHSYVSLPYNMMNYLHNFNFSCYNRTKISLVFMLSFSIALCSKSIEHLKTHVSSYATAVTFVTYNMLPIANSSLEDYFWWPLSL